jgi:hypothetical protein
MNAKETDNQPVTTCQICGRPVKSNTGKIAHHGYKRPGNGWQTASCMGARHLSYEQSYDIIPLAMIKVAMYIERQEKALVELLSNPPIELSYTRGTWTKELIKVSRPDNFKVDDYRSSSMHSYDTLFTKREYEIKQSIKFAKSDLEFLTDRLIKWVAPKPASN